MAQESWKNMEEDRGRQPPEGPVLCSNKCGFFGSSDTMNMCSKCYRDHFLAQTQASAVKSAVEKSMSVDIDSSKAPIFDVSGVRNPAEVVGSSSDDGNSVSSEEPARAPNRCQSCSKRVGLTGFKCRCGYVFCSLHRYSDKHGCSFDYKEVGRQEIEKSNPVVKAEKIQKI